MHLSFAVILCMSLPSKDRVRISCRDETTRWSSFRIPSSGSERTISHFLLQVMETVKQWCVNAAVGVWKRKKLNDNEDDGDAHGMFVCLII